MQKARILLIEDADSVREVLARQLEALGVLVTALPDGHNVKRELDQKKYDLVIADLHLPDCSGFDIARFAHAKKCKVILLSGDAVATSRDDYMTAQFDQILTKPVTILTLKNMLVHHQLITEDVLNVANSNHFDSSDFQTIDLKALEEQMGYLDDVVLQMLGRFPDMMRPLVDQLIHSSERGGMEKIVELAHSLKGAARSAGAMTLGLISEEIQDSAARKKIEKTQIQRLLSEFSKVDIEIKNMCSKKIATS